MVIYHNAMNTGYFQTCTKYSKTVFFFNSINDSNTNRTLSFDFRPKGLQQPKASIATENRHIICDSTAFHLEMWIPFYFSDNRVESIISLLHC